MKKTKLQIFGLNELKSCIRGPGGMAVIMDLPDGRVAVSDGHYMLFLQRGQVCPLVPRGRFTFNGLEVISGPQIDNIGMYLAIGIGDHQLQRDELHGTRYTLDMKSPGPCYVWRDGRRRLVLQKRVTDMAAKFLMMPWSPGPALPQQLSWSIPFSTNGKQVDGLAMLCRWEGSDVFAEHSIAEAQEAAAAQETPPAKPAKKARKGKS